MDLLVPQSYAVETENARREQMVSDHLGRAATFALALEELDPNLDLVIAHEGADAPDLVAGYWHVRRRNDGVTKDTYMPITDPDGNFSEPTERHLNELRDRDLWKSGAIDAIYKRIAAKDAARLRAEALTREQMRDEMAADIRAAKRVAGETLDKRRWGAGRLVA